jgi:hypothetical protein
MSTYREIHGKSIKSLSTDPSDDYAAGQIWYNTNSDTFKSILNIEAWSSAAPLSQKRTDPSGFGIQTANVCATGNIPPRTAVTEEYDGNGWTGGGTASQAGQYRAGFGTLTAGAIAGARTPAPAASNATEEYDGSSWTSGGNLPASIYLPGNQAAGTQTAGLVFGGDTGPGSSFPTASYEYNGTGWTAGNSTNTARSYGAGSGSQTAAFFACGTTPPFSPSNDSVVFEQYDGTNWTSGPNLNTARISTAAGGDTTTGLVFGGEVRPGPAVSNKLEKWDGTSWTTSPATMGTGRMGTGRALGTASATANIASGGYTTTPVATVEEYNSSVNAFTAAAWASGGNLATARNVLAGAGIQTAALMIGGNNPGTAQKGETEEYDGTSYSEQADLTTARSQSGSGGTTSAAIYFAGDVFPGSPRNTNKTEEYDGSSWTAQNTMSQERRALTGFGTQTAAVGAGGYSTTILNNVEEYDGTNWTAGNTLPAAKESLAGSGSLTAGLTFGGYAPPGPAVTATTEEYDGTNWTSGGSLITGRWGAGRGTVGPQTACLAFGGDSSAPAVQSVTEGYDGTSWSTRPNMATARRALGGAGTQTANLGSGGHTSTIVNTTEEFTGETSAVNVKTLTQS